MYIPFVSNFINRMRRLFWSRIACLTVSECGEKVYVNRKSKFSRNTILKNNVHFNGMTVLGKGNVIFGNNFHSGSECMIITDAHNYHGESIPYDSTYIIKNVTIEDNVWLGNRVMILGGVTIGEGAIIQAGSVVVRDIPPLSIAGGHPAMCFSKRDRIHYESKKLAKLFH